MHIPTVPTADIRRRLAAADDLDDRSILRAYRGLPVRPGTLSRITRAATEIGVAPPPRVDAGENQPRSIR